MQDHSPNSAAGRRRALQLAQRNSLLHFSALSASLAKRAVKHFAPNSYTMNVMLPDARVLPTKSHSSPWTLRMLLLLAACAFAWTVLDGVRLGSIRAGRGIWHRTVNRDNDPAEFWFAIIGNCVGCVAVLSVLIATLVYHQMLPP